MLYRNLLVEFHTETSTGWRESTHWVTKVADVAILANVVRFQFMIVLWNSCYVDVDLARLKPPVVQVRCRNLHGKVVRDALGICKEEVEAKMLQLDVV
jgi:predicted nuclease of predicted toxin-antitoxin system